MVAVPLTNESLAQLATLYAKIAAPFSTDYHKALDDFAVLSVMLWPNIAARIAAGDADTRRLDLIESRAIVSYPYREPVVYRFTLAAAVSKETGLRAQLDNTLLKEGT